MSIVILVATGCLALLGVFRSYLGERFALTRGRHAVWAVLLLGALAWLTVVAEPALLARPAALLGATLLAAIGGMHLVWAFGLRWGSVAAVPEHAGAALFVPGRAITLVVAGALFSATWLLLALSGFAPAPLPAAWLWALGLAAACVFGLRAIGDGKFVGLSKRVVGTRFARFDDMLFTPLCFLLSATIALQLVH